MIICTGVADFPDADDFFSLERVCGGASLLLLRDARLGDAAVNHLLSFNPIIRMIVTLSSMSRCLVTAVRAAGGHSCAHIRI
jgi:hypothetical protein